MRIFYSVEFFSYLYVINGDNFTPDKETCEVVLDFPKIGGEDIKDHGRKAI